MNVLIGCCAVALLLRFELLSRSAFPPIFSRHGVQPLLRRAPPATPQKPPPAHTVARSPLYDPTLSWDPAAPRPWMDPGLHPLQRPPAALLLTDLGWNGPDPHERLAQPRFVRETELYTALVNHPWFHPTLWQDLQQDPTLKLDPDVRYYVFVDRMGCTEMHYPKYGGMWSNMDLSEGRVFSGSVADVVFDYRQATDPAYNQPLFSHGIYAPRGTGGATVNVTTVLFDCYPGSMPELQGRPSPDYVGAAASHLGRVGGWTLPLPPISLVSLDGRISRSDEHLDQGLVPPLLKPVRLTEEQVDDIRTCRAEGKRSIHAVYAGNLRDGPNEAFALHNGGGARSAYLPYHDGNRTLVLPQLRGIRAYEEVLADSVFALVPRGDDKYSYRFSEALSAGAIPVVHADDWVLPFRPELVDWNECAVILPEKDAGRPALAILDAMPTQERCRRRKRCLEIYDRYVESPEKVLAGIVEGMELTALADLPKRMAGYRCSKAEADALACNPL